MRTLFFVATVFSGVSVIAGAQAQEDFQPERVTTEPGVGPGPHLFVAAGGRTHIMDPETLDYLGQISGGSPTQVVFPKDGKSVVLSTSFYERDFRGERSSYIEVFDSDTLAMTAEWSIPPKAAMKGPAAELAALSADERWLFIQNATPATSVTVVDLENQETTGEIPIPGCWGIYPVASDPQRFVSICGNGSFSTYTLSDDGASAEPRVSEKIFDVEDDPIFTDAAFDGETLMFVSYDGDIYTVDIGGPVAELTDTFSFVEGTEGSWKPTGSNLSAYDGERGVLFVLMRSDSYDGSHDEPAEEIWAVGLEDKTLLSRSTSRKLMNISRPDMDKPYLFGHSREDDLLVRYEIGGAPTYALREDKTEKLDGGSFVEVH